MKEYKLRIGVLAEMSFLIVLSLVAIGFLTSFIIKDIVTLNSYWEFIFLGIFIAIIGIYDFITLTYFKEDFGKKVTINSQNKELIIRKGNMERLISRKDINKCYHIKSDHRNSTNDPFRVHKYLAIHLKSRELIIISSLIIEPKLLLSELGLTSTLIKQFLPYIDYKIGSEFLSQEDYEKKVEEYCEIYKDKSKEELLGICKEPKVYAQYAVESARKLLKAKE